MSDRRRKAKIYEMRPHLEKIVESILYVVREAERHGLDLTQYDIVKTIFLADRTHLNRYGRPITFDNYFAMSHGPVPSMSYDVLKAQNDSLLKAYGRPLPWTHENIPNTKKIRFFNAKREIDEEVLSLSDQEALTDALLIVKRLGFAQVRKLTHEDMAYIDAWEDDGPATGRYQMSYALLFDSPSEDRAQDLSFLSSFV